MVTIFASKKFSNIITAYQEQPWCEHMNGFMLPCRHAGGDDPLTHIHIELFLNKG